MEEQGLTELERILIDMLSALKIPIATALPTFMVLETEEEQLALGFFLRDHLETGLREGELKAFTNRILSCGVNKQELQRRIQEEPETEGGGSHGI